MHAMYLMLVAVGGLMDPLLEKKARMKSNDRRLMCELVIGVIMYKECGRYSNTVQSTIHSPQYAS